MFRKTGVVLILSTATVLSLAGCVRPAVSPLPVPSASATSSARESCDGRSMTLNQPSTRYELSGDCDTISIQGQDITLAIDNAKAITINGDRNNVVVTSLGALTISGQDNAVSATKIGAVGINGDRNSVAATTLGAKTVNGQNNQVLG